MHSCAVLQPYCDARTAQRRTSLPTAESLTVRCGAVRAGGSRGQADWTAHITAAHTAMLLYSMPCCAVRFDLRVNVRPKDEVRDVLAALAHGVAQPTQLQVAEQALQRLLAAVHDLLRHVRAVLEHKLHVPERKAPAGR